MAKDNLFRKKETINLNGKLYDISNPLVMGILNVTPDSFYDGGSYLNKETIRTQVQKLINEGVDIIDIGGYSSRPGAKNITGEEEFKRISNALEIICSEFEDVIISVDTFRSSVIKDVIKHFRLDIINDITGGKNNNELAELAALHQLPYVVMHMRGNPQNMQQLSNYKHVINEMLRELAELASKAVDLGVNDIIIDPGFGFAKTAEQSFEVLNNLDLFSMLGHPLLVGLSRKSMIYKTLNIEPSEALNGTTALHMTALMKGAGILRVHDVKEARQVIDLFLKMTSKETSTTKN
ncbi:MAG: dihydropteroate synthase [Bacteroidales bacterium]|nr:dihydropteroate synthase [Bacteroidales bacterium]